MVFIRQDITNIIIIIEILIDVCNPLKNMCDFSFVLLSYLDYLAFLLQTSVKMQESVISDSFRSMLLGGFVSRIVMARELSSDAGLHPSSTR